MQLSIAGDPLLSGPVTDIQFDHGSAEVARGSEQLENAAHPVGLLGIDEQTASGCVYVVAQHGNASRPPALAARRRYLVARALGDNLPFELRETKQNVQG